MNKLVNKILFVFDIVWLSWRNFTRNRVRKISVKNINVGSALRHNIYVKTKFGGGGIVYAF